MMMAHDHLRHRALVVVLLLLHLSSSLLAAHLGHYSTSWTSTPAMPFAANFSDGSQVRPVLLLLPPNTTGVGPAYACGFYCRGYTTCGSSLFAVFIIQVEMRGGNDGVVTQTAIPPQVVWAANKARPVGENATLRLGPDGDLVLRDADGTKVWSTGTSGKPVTSINLTEYGNLVLFGGDNKNNQNQSVWWESFAHPTDSLLPGQKLWVGQNLTANDSATNSTEGPSYYLSATSTDGLVAFIKSEPGQTRYSSFLPQTTDDKEEVEYYLLLVNGSISTSSSESEHYYSMPSSPQTFLRLDSDGHLRVYQWSPAKSDWVIPRDLLSPDQVFSLNNNHRQLDEEATPHNSTAFVKVATGIRQTNSSNSTATGIPQTNSSNSTATGIPTNSSSNSTAGIPTNSSSNPTGGDNKESGTAKAVILGYLSGAIFLLSLLAIGACLWNANRIKLKQAEKNRDVATEDGEEGDVEHVSGIPRRFSLEELRAATNGFRKKLGQGGFGSVYEGRIDGRAVAVKRLDGVLGHGRRDFLAEVQTVGKIHHVNLVKLIGYCTEESFTRLLVYEFMPNGSLDRWIFPSRAGREAASSLDWPTRCKIILGVAKGLCYLHEDCTQRIAHLDVKPENILLDQRFNPKLSDFGLAKLIDRDQSHVNTRMRGTHGYLAPEWLSAIITEKVDVYSFGVVVLEIVCGRRNLVRSQPEVDMLLVTLLKRKAEEGRVLDLVDDRIKEDTRRHVESATKLMQIAGWCLQDHRQRPSMSVVVKALEDAVGGVVEFQPSGVVQCSGNASGPLSSWVLSGPR